MSRYEYGRLKSVTGMDTNGNPVAQTSYAYDPHGRVSAVTDARNGTTAFGYDSADHVRYVTNPPPAVGEAPPTTSYHYTSLGQVAGVGHPDQGTTTGESRDAGERAGSRQGPGGVGL